MHPQWWRRPSASPVTAPSHLLWCRSQLCHQAQATAVPAGPCSAHSLPSSHWIPTKPSGQKQTKEPGRSRQVPPFLQGSDWHSSTSAERRDRLRAEPGLEAGEEVWKDSATRPHITRCPEPPSQKESRAEGGVQMAGGVGLC